MRLCSGQWDVKGSDPHNFWITSSKKEPLVLSFSSPFPTGGYGDAVLPAATVGAGNSLGEGRTESSVTKNLHSTRNCGNVFFGGLRNGQNQTPFRPPPGWAPLVWNSEVFSKSPDSLFESSGNSMLRAFNTRKHPSRAHTGRAESSGGNLQEDSSRHPSPARGASHRPAIRPADLPDLGVSGPEGIRGTSGLGSPPPERPTPPGGRGLWGPVTVRGQLPSQWPAQPPAPNSIEGTRGKKNAAPGPLRMQFSILTEGTTEGKGFRP